MKLTLLLSLILIYFKASADPRSIHVIKILDTQYPSPELTLSIKYFEQGINQEANLIKKNLGLSNLVYHRIFGVNFNRKAVDRRIDTLSITKGDIIILLYAGHGVRDESTATYFPKLVLEIINLLITQTFKIEFLKKIHL